MSNHLKHETSPYLLQHADNPVDWYPWCDEAFERARRENKPVFLSIGYSTCHWCHVMAHESFEDAAVAAFLNRYFISVKVDREERPDVDSVYMSVCQAFTGSGGWPMTIFMTWEKKPFFAGTYFPAVRGGGMPSFSELLYTVAERWNSGREELLRPAGQVIDHLKREIFTCTQEGADEAGMCERALGIFSAEYDPVYGGFGAAPKFPMPHNLLFLTLCGKRYGRADILAMVEKTLTQMRKGGIFDQIGGGFSRYSTDPYFLAPHFEKMLYDNAFLIMAYAAAYEVTKAPLYLDTAKRTAAYVLREMTDAGGGFYSAQDADSEGVEGKYYTFTREEILDVLGTEPGERFAQVYDITPEGNFEGVSIPNLLKSKVTDSAFDEALETLCRYRKGRFQLHLDDKILTAWNGMMAAALSMLCRISHEERYLTAAKRAMMFLEEQLCDGMGLFASWRDGKRSKNGFLDDYAYYTAALIELYNTTLDLAYLEKAERFCMEAVKRFADGEKGGFYLSPSDDAELFLNPKECYDGAVPSGNSVMAYNLVRLYQLTGKEELGALAEKQLRYLSGQAQNAPTGYGMFLLAKQLYDDPPAHIVIALKDALDLEGVRAQLPFLANVKVAAGEPGGAYPLVNNRTTFYVCRGHTCLAPVHTLEDWL